MNVLGVRQMCLFKGNGQKRELPVVSWLETGVQNYEGSKHSIWAHVIGQHHLPPVSGRTTTGTSRFSLLWSCLLYTSPSPRDATLSRMPSSA